MDANCVFCQIVAGKSPADIVFEDKLFLAFLDKYPQARGHLQLIPKKHYRWIYDVPEIGEIFVAARKIIRAIIPVLGASHVLLATLGEEVPHAHIWIVPQYKRRLENSREDREALAHLLREAIKKEV